VSKGGELEKNQRSSISSLTGGKRGEEKRKKEEERRAVLYNIPSGSWDLSSFKLKAEEGEIGKEPKGERRGRGRENHPYYSAKKRKRAPLSVSEGGEEPGKEDSSASPPSLYLATRKKKKGEGGGEGEGEVSFSLYDVRMLITRGTSFLRLPLRLNRKGEGRGGKKDPGFIFAGTGGGRTGGGGVLAQLQVGRRA